MKYICLISLLIIGISFKSNAQFLLERKNIDEIRKFESGQHSENTGFKKMQVGHDFFHNTQEKVDYYPLIFKRIEDSFKPQCEAEYFYSSKDSIVNGIIYEWNIANEISNIKTDGHKFEEQLTRKDDYLQQYNTIRDLLIKLLGNPSQTEEIAETRQGYFGETEWNLHDKDVTLYFSFTPKLQIAGPYKFGTFRVRLKEDWK